MSLLVSARNDPRGSGTIWTLDLAAQISNFTPILPAAFCRVGLESLYQLAGEGGGVPDEDFRTRFETERRCYAAFVADQLAAFGWVSLEEEWIGELRLRLKLQPGEAYIWDCFTMPAFRQRYLYTALLSYIARSLQEEHLQRVWIGTNTDNLASQRGITRAGFQLVARIAVERVLALRQVWVKGLPGVPESLVAEARRVFLSDRDRVWREAPTAQRRHLTSTKADETV
jgi:ribosomal protein S18 acetylase RimI-like enzyme